jgi:hypothetical protein
VAPAGRAPNTICVASGDPQSHGIRNLPVPSVSAWQEGHSTEPPTVSLCQKVPCFSVKSHLVHVLYRLVVGRTSVERDTWQQPRERDMVKVRRLMHDVLAREVVATLFEHVNQWLSKRDTRTGHLLGAVWTWR